MMAGASSLMLVLLFSVAASGSLFKSMKEKLDIYLFLAASYYSELKANGGVVYGLGNQDNLISAEYIESEQ